MDKLRYFRNMLVIVIYLNYIFYIISASVISGIQLHVRVGVGFKEAVLSFLLICNGVSIIF